MLTNNGRLFLLPVSQSANKTFKLISGSESTATDNNAKNMFTNTNYGGSILFGTGTTTPTKNDYELEQPLENSLAVSLISRSNAASTSSVKYDDVPSLLYVTVLVTNETETDISVTEIGMTSFSSANVTNKMLLTRTVLDEPITMESGKTYQITVAIN